MKNQNYKNNREERGRSECRWCTDRYGVIDGAVAATSIVVNNWFGRTLRDLDGRTEKKGLQQEITTDYIIKDNNLYNI